MHLVFLTPLLLTINSFSFDLSDTLLDQYHVVCESVVNQRGFAEGDSEAITNLRNAFHDLNAENSGPETLAAELQLTLWIGDHEQADLLFRQLMAALPENPSIGLAWSRFALALPDANSEAIFNELRSLYPTSPEIVLNWARELDGKNRFNEALAAMDGLDPQALTQLDAAGLYADLLFANNRFDEALAAMDAVDTRTFAGDAAKQNALDSRKTRISETATKWQDELAIREIEAEMDDLPRVQLITSKGPILLELFEDHAPNTVANFVSLADSGYYDGTRFHRVLAKFMAQGGDPNSREGATGQAGSGGPGYKIKDEHTGEDIRHHFAGTLSMAKTSAPNSAGSQFFLTHMPTPHLDGRHTVFGRIVEGLEIARLLEKNDDILTATVLRKRDHEYIPEKLGSDGKPLTDKTPKEEVTEKTPKPTLNSTNTPTLNSTSKP
ncbi:MAG: peptidylprolyl isomerase [Phycisphaerales bacterium]|jgi:cyclophilin family peptidyl-prolyl cis-trans isomerase|nr:peptidylprolyl isomerase [Phycisphaerales bacterium]